MINFTTHYIKKFYKNMNKNLNEKVININFNSYRKDEKIKINLEFLIKKSIKLKLIMKILK